MFVVVHSLDKSVCSLKMADDENQLLEDARRRPLAERVAHKLWKARVEVYEEMRSKCEKVFSEEDPLLGNYGKHSAARTPQSISVA